MDPISGIAGVIAIVGATNTTVHGITRIRTLRKALKSIDGLVDEVEVLRRFLTDIQQLHESMETHRVLLLKDSPHVPSNVNPKSESLLSIYLTQAGTKLSELDELIGKKFSERSTRRRKGFGGVRLAWLSSEGRVNAIRDDIHSINTNMTACLAMTAVTAQLRLQNYLEEATSGTREVVLSNARIESFRSGVDSPHASQIERVDSTKDSDQRRSRPGHPSTSYPSQMSRNLLQNESYCKSCCACCCHKRVRIQTSSIVGNLVGSLNLTYSLVRSHLACNDKTCQRRLRVILNLTCHFPRWFLSRVINTYWGSDSIGCPTVALRVPRIRPDTAPIFHLAAAGDLSGMRRMFRLGLASPDDVSYAFGYSVLHFAVDMEDVEAIKFLIGEGANPMLANRLNLTAVDLTWNRILCKRPSEIKRAELTLLFGAANLEDQINSRRLTRLQQVILGLVNADLDRTLQSSSQIEINATDADGNTALSWAARSCNAVALRALLKRGAEPHKASRFGSTAMHYAASASSPDCIRPLLEAGADPNVRNTCLWETPVHVAALRHDDPESFLAPLLEYKADLNTCDHEGSSALAFAIQANHVRSAIFLLDHGAQVDAPDVSNMPPIGVAVMYKRSVLLEALLERGASVDFVTDTGETMLHLVALYGDLAIVSTLKAARHQLPRDVLDEKGMDALTYAKARSEEDFLAGFTELIAMTLDEPVKD